MLSWSSILLFLTSFKYKGGNSNGKDKRWRPFCHRVVKKWSYTHFLRFCTRLKMIILLDWRGIRFKANLLIIKYPKSRTIKFQRLFLTYLEDHETRNKNKYGTHKIILLHLAVYFVIREFLSLLTLQRFPIPYGYGYINYGFNEKLYHCKYYYVLMEGFTWC